MTRKSNRPINLLAACGLVAGLSAVTYAQPQTPRLINLSGATLQENFLSAPAQGNDYIDANNDGYSRLINPPPAAVQRLNLSNNLAFTSPYPAIPALPDRTRLHWIIQYRAVGSINGFIELEQFGRTDLAGTNAASYITTDALGPLTSRACERAYANGDGNSTAERYINTGSGAGRANFNPGNPGGAPVRSMTNGTYLATAYNVVPCGDSVPADGPGPNEPIPAGGVGGAWGCPGVGGIQIDIAALDVPSAWAVQVAGGSPDPLDKPFAAGYGRNPRLAVAKSGATFSPAFGAVLAPLTTRNLYAGGAADVNTIFDTSTTFTPIAPITSYGTGYQQMTYSQLRHLFAAGRLPSGENLMAITRDTGSGTHNGMMNSIGLDPSWGIGENIAGGSGLSSSTPENNLGSSFVPGNKSGSGGLESTIYNVRLGIGYTGAERGINSGWLPNRINLLAVQKDGVRSDSLPGDFVRPTIDRVLNNGLRGQTDPSSGLIYTVDGFQIGGPAVFASLGFARNAPANKGGWGWDAVNEAGVNPNAALPAMSNVEAAAYINNISRSLDAINANPGSASNDSTPGEFLAATFILPAATDYRQEVSDPTSFVLNTERRQTVQDFTLAPGFNALSNSAYSAFDTTKAGLVPVRNSGAGISYGDGVVDGLNYINQNGVAVSYGGTLSLRNKIAGDFNNDGARTAADVNDMLLAYKDRNVDGAPVTWQAGTDAVIEILGDFTCDGRFDQADIRYWADGLHVVSGSLNRAAGFLAVDSAWNTIGGSSNFFGTTMSTGAAYTPGASAADVCNATEITPRGFVQVVDGKVDVHDVKFIYAQFRDNVSDGEANWDDIAEAVKFDLSADVNGDLKVNEDDITAILGPSILKARRGDIDLNGRVDLCDYAISNLSQGQSLPAARFTTGDANRDGSVNAADLAIILCQAADRDGNGSIEPTDIAVFVGDWSTSLTAGTLVGDYDCNGAIEPSDIAGFVNNWVTQLNVTGGVCN
ncbi:MAG: hypothetical protein KF745_03860 [Phycisphaeraceae bacterium]|nr:hypothetical protein [Phycisphaeraceae bacterium]